MRKCNILGVNITVTNMEETVNYIDEKLEDLKGEYICVSNVHTTVMAHEDDFYRDIQNNGVLALPDGNPLSILSRKRGFIEAERVTGPDLMGEIFRISEAKGYTHYFYGSTNKTLDLLVKNLKVKYPNLKVVGKYSPAFSKDLIEESEEKICEINNSKADFLWVGLGAPKQEIWMSTHKNKVDSLMIGVGAGFDYYAGNIKRAPMILQKLSLEWLYRLFQEPKRLFKRYLITNFKFLYEVIIKNNKSAY